MAFESSAPNLVPGDSSGTFHVFVHVLESAETTRVSVGPQGDPGDRGCYFASLSASRRFVACDSLVTHGRDPDRAERSRAPGPGLPGAGTLALGVAPGRGVLVPQPDAVLPWVTDAGGAAFAALTCPVALPPGLERVLQAWSRGLAGRPQALGQTTYSP